MKFIVPEDYIKINDSPVCLVNEKHHYNDGLELLELVSDKVFVDLPHICMPCKKVNDRKYAIGVNNKNFTHSNELFLDTVIEIGFHNLVLEGNIKYPDKKKELRQLQNDLTAYNKEKKYDKKPVTENEKINFLLSQNYYVKDFRDDKNQPIKYSIHMPLNRIFTLPSEAAAINSLSTVPVETNFHGMKFIVYKDDGDGSK